MFCLVELALHVHPIDHFANAFLEALRLLLEDREARVEIRSEHVALRDRAFDGRAPDRLRLFNGCIVLAHRGLEIAAAHAVGDLINGNPGIHGARFDRANHALDCQSHDIGAIRVVDRRIANDLEKRLKPIERCGLVIEQRLDHIVKIGMAHFIHADDGIDGRYHHDIVGSVDPGIGLLRIEQRFDHHQKAPAVLGSAHRQFEIGVRLDNHARQRVVQLVEFPFIPRTIAQPDEVQIDQPAEIAQQRKNLHHLGRIGGISTS